MRIRFHRFLVPTLLASLPVLPASGCWMEEFDETEEPSEEAPELPPRPLPLEDSPSAYGMLRVANELGFSALDDDVGLDRQAAASILAHRAGPDERNGTADDRYVEDLAELDSLYWLGETNLWRLQAHALAEGWVPEGVPASCEPALSEALDGCRAFMIEGITGAGDATAVEAASWRCVELGDAEASAAGYFAAAGLMGYLDPALGYHAMLCGDASANASLCELGVAGLASHALPECVIEAG